jgi:dihydroxy-acid dehydratase
LPTLLGKFRAEEIDAEEISDVNNQLVASVGTCSVAGTASTMACIAEALGIGIPGSATPPAVTADRIRIAERSGEVAVHMARAGLSIDKILTPAAFENAMRVLLAMGGSTNAIVHLAAIAGRLGYELDLKALDVMSRNTPVLLDLKPSGDHYMEDFHAAGGMHTLLRELKPLLHLDALTVTGRTLGEELEAAGPASSSMWSRLWMPLVSTGRHCRAARQSCPGRRHHQAVRSEPRADGA